jgi:hypothetical protein
MSGLLACKRGFCSQGGNILHVFTALLVTECVSAKLKKPPLMASECGAEVTVHSLRSRPGQPSAGDAEHRESTDAPQAD